MIILSFTTLPFWMYYYLGISCDNLSTNPEYIVVMGGGGIPGESGLMRTYFSAQAAKKYPAAKLIIALPGNPEDSTDATFLMQQELVMRGVEKTRIIFENKGKNTRSQALEIKKIIPDNTAPVLLITSPEHMYRSVLTFKKAGFKNTGGEPAFEKTIPVPEFEDDDLGGRKIIPDIKNTQLRYQFWNHFKYQIIVYREYCAIAYYKLKGWI